MIGPREAVQPMSAFSRICDIGLSALPLKFRGALRSAASRIADSAIAIGAITVELRGAGGSGGNSTSAGARTSPRGATKSMSFRLTTNDMTTTASAIDDCLQMHRQTHRPPDQLDRPRGVLQGRGEPRQCGDHQACACRCGLQRASRVDHGNLQRLSDLTISDRRQATKHLASWSCLSRAIVRKVAAAECSLPVMRSTAMA